MFGSDLEKMLAAGAVEQTAMAAGGLVFLSDLNDAASRLGLSTSDFSQLAVRRFFERADDDSILSLISAVNRADRPDMAALEFILKRAVLDAREVFR